MVENRNLKFSAIIDVTFNNSKTKRVCLNCKIDLKYAQLSAIQADIYETFTYAENKDTFSNNHNEKTQKIYTDTEAQQLIYGFKNEHR